MDSAAAAVSLGLDCGEIHNNIQNIFRLYSKINSTKWTALVLFFQRSHNLYKTSYNIKCNLKSDLKGVVAHAIRLN